MLLGFELSERIERLAEVQEQESDRTKNFDFQGSHQYFKIYTVPVGLPKYRLANIRTKSAQKEYIAKDSKSDEEFFDDPEDELAQKAQHELLIKMGKNLIQLFEKEHDEQKDALILDNKGFVVNGNRRLSVLRMLYNKDSEKYRRFSHIDVVILPPCVEKDIQELERVLQIEKDVKQDYDWHATAMQYRETMESEGLTYKQLQNHWKVSGIEHQIRGLEFAEEYLESRGWTNQFSRLSQGAEYAFVTGMSKELKKKTFPIDKTDLFKKLAFEVIDDPTGVIAFKQISEIAKNIEVVAKGIEQAYDEKEIETSEEVVKGGGEIGGTGVFGGGGSDRATDIIEKSTDKELLREIVKDSLEADKAKKKFKQTKLAVISELKKTQDNLLRAQTAIKTTRTLDKKNVISTLDEIDDLLTSIRNWANDD